MMRYWKLEFSMDLNLCSSWWTTIEELTIPITLDNCVYATPRMVTSYISISHNIFVVFNSTLYFPVEMTEKEKKIKS